MRPFARLEGPATGSMAFCFALFTAVGWWITVTTVFSGVFWDEAVDEDDLRLRPRLDDDDDVLAGIGFVGTTFGVDVMARALLETTENADRRPGRFVLIGDKELRNEKLWEKLI